VSGVVAIATGYQHNLALKADGTILAWGSDFNGELGDGAPIESGCACHATPQQVRGVSHAAAIAANGHSLVIAAAPAPTVTAANDAPGSYGVGATFVSATVTSGGNAAHGGTVTFTIKDAGGATIGSPVVGLVGLDGVASASYPLPPTTPAGNYTIEANYSGVLSFDPSSDPTPATLTIARVTANTTVGIPTVIPSCGSVGATIPVTVDNANSNVPITGGSVTVTVMQGATVVGVGSAAIAGPDPVTVNVTVPLSGLTAGNATATATYSGDSNFNGSTASPLTFAVPLTPNTVTVPTALATYGDASVTLTATITSANGAPFSGGTVTFVVKKGNQTIATLTSAPVVGPSPTTVSVTLPLNASHEARNYTIEASYNGTTCAQSASGAGTLQVKRRILYVKPTNRTVGLKQPNPPTTPPANCLASQTPTSACWIELANGTSFAYGQSWSALNLANLRFQYSRNPPSTNASEYVGKTYRMTAFGVSSPNYDIRYQEGTLTVVQP
jgi:hypothetical protein